MAFNPHLWYLNGLKKVGANNTLIGGVSSVINTPALLAAKLRNYPSGSAFDPVNIQNFTIVGDDIECYIGVDYQIDGTNGSGFNLDYNIVNYFDYGGHCLKILTGGFRGNVASSNKLKEVFFPNLLWLQGSFRERDGVVIIIPKCNQIGNTIGNDEVFSLSQNQKIYCDPSLQTVNSGNPDGDLTYAISQGSAVVYVQNFTAPNPITDLTIGDVYATALQLNFTAPTGSENAIDFYDCYANGRYKNTISGSGEYITGLTPNTTYNIEVKPVDIYYNKSTSNIVTQATTNGSILDYPINEHLVSYYKMENNVLDSWGTNNGTPTAITYASGLVGQTAVLGATSKINCGNSASLQLTNLSLVCVVKSSGFGTGDKGILFKRYAYNVFSKSNILSTYSYGTPVGYKETGINIADNINHVIVLAQQSGVTNGTKIYLDGNLVLTTTVGQTAQTDNLDIGAMATNIGITSQIDEASVFNTILNAAEVSEITAKLNSGQSLI